MAEMLTQPEGTYWHFLCADRRLGYKDGRKVVVGKTLTFDGEAELRRYGLHASARVTDALKYAPGSVVCLVTFGGKVLHGHDKSVAGERTALWVYDAEQLLRDFACTVAENVLLAERDAGYEPAPASWDAIAVSRRYAKGEATDEELSRAYWAADRAAYWAADSGAGKVASEAADSAAHKAASWAAYRAADSGADIEARQQQNEMLTSMLMAEYNKEKQIEYTSDDSY